MAALAAGSSAGDPPDPGAIGFWNVARRGANCQNRRVTPEYWQAARQARIEFVRLIPDEWPTRRRDFLIGDASAFDSLDHEDLAALRRVLDDAHAAGVHVVLTCFSLPGARWRQLNGDRDDQRLWTQEGFRAQALAFWRQLAAELRGHPAIVAYNPLNEPHPERAFGMVDPDSATFAEWYRTHRGTLADLNDFNREMVAAIRAADPTTPILLDGWFHASPRGLTFLDPVADHAVLYAFHDYEPWEYKTYRINRGRFVYPTRMPEGWTLESPEQLMRDVEAWATRHGIPRSRVVAAEFGVDRRVGGARECLTDTVDRLERHGWHWAFYAFRDDGSWGGLDYELGTAPLGAAYWKAVEAGADPEKLKQRGPNPLWDVLAKTLDRTR
jgi:endoglucanase